MQAAIKNTSVIPPIIIKALSAEIKAVANPAWSWQWQLAFNSSSLQKKLYLIIWEAFIYEYGKFQP